MSIVVPHIQQTRTKHIHDLQYYRTSVIVVEIRNQIQVNQLHKEITYHNIVITLPSFIMNTWYAMTTTKDTR